MNERNGKSNDSESLDDTFFDEPEAGRPRGPKGIIGQEEEEELERIFQPASARARHPVLAGTVAAASLLVLWMMRADIAYFFQGSSPRELGDAAKALKDGKFQENTYVRIKGLPDLNTKATVNRKGCGLAPNTGTSNYYNFYIVQNTGDSVVVRRSLTAKQRQKETTHPILELDVSGRLVRFASQKEFFNKYRRYIVEASKTFPALQREYEIPRSQIRKNVGKGRVTLRDTKGRPVTIVPDSSLSLYVIFPDELEYRLDRTFALSPNHVTFIGGSGPKCPSDFSGSAVVLVKSLSALDFGPDIKSKAKIQAPDAPTTGAAGKDLRILVPPDTKVYDSKTGDPIPFTSGQLIVAEGGACGKPGQARTVNLESHPLYRLSAAKDYLRRYGLPYGLVDQDSDSFLFIIKGPPSKLEAIVKAQKRASPYSASSRTDWFEARWSELKLEEDTLVIRPARPSHPPRYVLVEPQAKPRTGPRPEAAGPPAEGRPSSKVAQTTEENARKAAPDKKATGDKAKATKPQDKTAGKDSRDARDAQARPTSTPAPKPSDPLDRVRKRAWQGEVRFPADWVDHATVTQTRAVPKDAWLLLEGVRPRKFWYFPVLGLLLILFALYNLWAIRSYFKYVKGAAKGTR